jgi:hypothetical protein
MICRTIDTTIAIHTGFEPVSPDWKSDSLTNLPNGSYVHFLFLKSTLEIYCGTRRNRTFDTLGFNQVLYRWATAPFVKFELVKGVEPILSWFVAKGFSI